MECITQTHVSAKSWLCSIWQTFKVETKQSYKNTSAHEHTESQTYNYMKTSWHSSYKKTPTRLWCLTLTQQKCRRHKRPQCCHVLSKNKSCRRFTHSSSLSTFMKLVIFGRDIIQAAQTVHKTLPKKTKGLNLGCWFNILVISECEFRDYYALYSQKQPKNKNKI